QEWALAEWLMTSSTSQTKVDCFLNMLITRQCISPSYKDKRIILQKIDRLQGPTCKCCTIMVKVDVVDEKGKPIEEDLDICCRNPVEYVHELIGNPDIWDAMKYGPECLFSDESEQEEIINEMWITQWWWDTQVRALVL
ncbi:hypothetical protein JB92DRAFT_2779828, partial [Gautieria morchelliformis]